MARHPLGIGCQCAKAHNPKAYVGALHHIIPQSWGGKSVPDNLVWLCPNTHTAVHRLIDDYVRAGRDPGWEVRRQFGPYVRFLAASAWSKRPPNAGITSTYFHT